MSERHLTLSLVLACIVSGRITGRRKLPMGKGLLEKQKRCNLEISLIMRDPEFFRCYGFGDPPLLCSCTPAYSFGCSSEPGLCRLPGAVSYEVTEGHGKEELAYVV